MGQSMGDVAERSIRRPAFGKDHPLRHHHRLILDKLDSQGHFALLVIAPEASDRHPHTILYWTAPVLIPQHYMIQGYAVIQKVVLKGQPVYQRQDLLQGLAVVVEVQEAVLTAKACRVRGKEVLIIGVDPHAVFQRLGQTVQIPEVFVQSLSQSQTAAVVRTELRRPGLHIDLELLAVQRHSDQRIAVNFRSEDHLIGAHLYVQNLCFAAVSVFDVGQSHFRGHALHVPFFLLTLQIPAAG